MWKLPYNLFIKNRLPETTSLLPVITFIPSTSYTFFLMLCVFCSHIPLFSTLYTLYTGKTLAPVYVQYQYIRLLHDRLRNRKALRIPREYFFTDFFDPGSRPTCSMIWLRYWLSFLFRIRYRYARFLSPMAFLRNAGSSMMIPTEKSSSPASSPSRRP